ncbi:MAG: exonuclease SbcCD subunit D [Anaerolineales bacterium]
MTEPIRLLHFADVHIGMENYGGIDPESGTSTRVRDFLDRLDEVVDYGLAHEADLAIFAGDAFKHRDPDPTQQREFARRIKRLADQVPTLLLVGNHDMPAVATKANSVDIFRALEVPNVIVGHTPGSQVVQTRRGPVFLAWMPYPMRNRLLTRESYQGKSIEELGEILRQTVADIVRQLTVEAQDQSMPRVLAGHLSVAEAKLGSERTAMLGQDVAITRSSLADSAWDYIALGHIHRHQIINPEGYPPIVYSGSLERIDFGEEGEQKGFCWVKLARGETDWEFVPVKARHFQTIRVDAREAEDPTAAAAAKADEIVEASVVRLIVKMNASQEASFVEREVLKAFEAASHVTINREVEAEARARLGTDAPEALTPMELLDKYLEARQVDPGRREELLQRAEDLLNAN